jgi:hypothetical protein
MTVQEKVTRRGDPRTRVLMTATLTSPRGIHKVLVRDISHDGAQIYTDKTISADHDAYFQRGPIFVAVRVAWCGNGVAGLKFYRRLTTSERDAAFHSVFITEGDQR